jgi:hypothetical protein
MDLIYCVRRWHSSNGSDMGLAHGHSATVVVPVETS